MVKVLIDMGWAASTYDEQMGRGGGAITIGNKQGNNALLLGARDEAI